MLTLRGQKQQHKSSSAGDTAAARAAPGHSLAGHVLGAGHAPAAPFPGKWPRSSPPAQLECEMGNQRHNSSVFIPAPCKSKQRTEPESKRIHQVFLSGPHVPQWPRNGLVTLRSCSVVFHVCPRGIMAIFSSPAFPLHILSSPRKALVLCAPGGVDGSHPLFLGQKELCRAHRGDWQG